MNGTLYALLLGAACGAGAFVLGLACAIVEIQLRAWWERRRAQRKVPPLVLLALSMFLTACGPSAEARTRTALDVVARAVDPAYAATMARCTDQIASVIAGMNAGAETPEGAEVQLNVIAQRCHQLRAAFEAVRVLHDEAAELVEAGKIDDARAALRALQEAWARLRETGGGEMLNPWAKGTP